MYKITINDANCCPICDGTVSFFTEDIEKFEQHFFTDYINQSKNYSFGLSTKDMEKLRGLYERSKNGELVTDYYDSKDPEINIFQYDSTAEVLEEKEYILSNRFFELENVYQWCSEYYVKNGFLKIRKIRFKGKEFYIGKYRLEGVCRKDEFAFGVYPFIQFTEVKTFGNPIFLQHKRELNVKEHNQWAEKRNGDSVDYFENNWLETFCWVLAPDFAMDESRMDEILRFVMVDIVGEAG